MKYLLLSLIGFVFFSCKTTKKMDAIQSEMEGQFVQFYLKKSPCFGRCPIYTLEIKDDGTAILDAQRFMDNLGVFTKKVDKTSFDELKSLYLLSDFEAYPTMYESNIPDYPMAAIGYCPSDSDTLKIVKGKEGRPDALMAIQDAMEKIAKSTDGWTLKSPANVDDINEGEIPPLPIDKTRIILKLTEETNLPSWFKIVRNKYGVRILSRIHPKQNDWLITYDASLVEGDELLKDLRRDVHVTQAEYENVLKSQ